MRRTTRAFCVGQAKSGTASLYGLLASCYRTAHEPEREQTLDFIQRRSLGELDAQSIAVYLQQRDQRLKLEYDIAWANQFIIDDLLAVFPDATFVILIRDPYTWLQSMVGHLLSRQIPPDVRSFLGWWFEPGKHPHTHHDRMLEAHNVYSITAFVNAWDRHVKTCTQFIPQQRRLILRTHELKYSSQRIAEFLKIPAESLAVGNVRLNQSTWAGRLDELVDAAYLTQVVDSIAGESMASYFPEISGFEDARGLWDRGVGQGPRAP